MWKKKEICATSFHFILFVFFLSSGTEDKWQSSVKLLSSKLIMLGKYDDKGSSIENMSSWERQVVTPRATTHKDTSFNQFDIRGCILKIQYKKERKREMKENTRHVWVCCLSFFFCLCVCEMNSYVSVVQFNTSLFLSDDTKIR